jgi:ribosomal protein L7Ae-like RNA K-turn-binding protein
MDVTRTDSKLCDYETAKKNCLQLIGLAKRVNIVLEGVHAIQHWISKGKELKVLLHSKDGSNKIAEKLDILSGCETIIYLFEAEELSKIVGKKKLAHIGLIPHKLTDSFLYAYMQLQEMNLCDNKPEKYDA